MFEQALLVHYFLILQLLGEPGSHCTNGEIKKQKGQQILNRGTQMFIFFVFTDKIFNTSHLLRGPQGSLPLTQLITIFLWPKQSC